MKKLLILFFFFSFFFSVDIAFASPVAQQTDISTINRAEPYRSQAKSDLFTSPLDGIPSDLVLYGSENISNGSAFDVYIETSTSTSICFKGSNSSSIAPSTVGWFVSASSSDWSDTYASSSCQLVAGQQYRIAVTIYGFFADPYVEFYGVSSSSPAFKLYLNGETYDEQDTCDSGNTRICDFTPAEGSILDNNVNFTLQAYINEDDTSTSTLGKRVKITLHNLEQNVLLAGTFSPNDIYLFEGNATSTGLFYYATTTTLADGNYRIEACVEQSYLGGAIINVFGNLNDCQSHQFIVNEGTFIGGISQSSYDLLNNVLASTTATTTIGTVCSPIVADGTFGLGFNASSSIPACLAFLFIPDASIIGTSINNFQTNVSSRFPLGYISDFYSIITSTTTGTLTVIDAYVPSPLPGANSHVYLDLSHAVDFVLYATTSIFSNSSASSSETFFEITNRYWQYVLYLLCILYILRRIFGGAVIPTFGDHGSLSDNSSSDDSYKLKEWLYRNKK